MVNSTSIVGDEILFWAIPVDDTGWFKLNDGKLFSGQSPRRFLGSNREIVHTSSMCPYKDLT